MGILTAHQSKALVPTEKAADCSESAAFQMVEPAGIEPASDLDFRGLLRAQSA